MAEILRYRKRSRKVDAEADITDCLARIIGKGIKPKLVRLLRVTASRTLEADGRQSAPVRSTASRVERTAGCRVTPRASVLV
jgi:hypothetical protein